MTVKPYGILENSTKLRETYWRFEIDGGWMRPDRNPSYNANHYWGYHATDVIGAIGIIRDRTLRPSEWYPHGIYCHLAQNARHLDDTMQVASKVFNGNKD